jgi:uncharacterized protein YcbK (DUF882 family)
MPDSARANIVALVEQVLDSAREGYGKPVCVNSGYRCARHNAAVGGVANSQHTRGEAADIRCDNNKELERILTRLGRYDQLIIYPTFIHVSWKQVGVNRRMTFNK